MKNLIKAKHKVDYHNAMCDYAERVCKSVNNRGFQIKMRLIGKGS